MFLEYWMLAVLLGVFAAGLIHTSRSAFNDGLEHGSEVLLAVLEREGYIRFGNEEAGELEKLLLKPVEFEVCDDKGSA